MTDSSPTIVDRFIEHEHESEALTFEGRLPSTVENLLVSKQGRRK